MDGWEDKGVFGGVGGLVGGERFLGLTFFLPWRHSSNKGIRNF